MRDHRTTLFDWLMIPAGPFLMGVEAGVDALPRPDERPQHVVALAEFCITRTPVTNAQYAAFVAASGYHPPEHWEGAAPPEWLTQHPVTYVDWHDAQAFCAWAGVRLPSEAEWEKAARGTDGRRYPWGERQPDTTLAHFDQAAGAPGTAELAATLPGPAHMARWIWPAMSGNGQLAGTAPTPMTPMTGARIRWRQGSGLCAAGRAAAGTSATCAAPFAA
jgi:serine/threonine-protein kinase